MDRYDQLIDREVASGQWSWDSDRALLYAVGVGAGLDDPLQELQFTTENTPGIEQKVIPSFATLMGLSLKSNWMELCGWAAAGEHPVGLVHGEQAITITQPIPSRGTVDVSTVVRGVFDKGSGALLVLETLLTLTDSGQRLGSCRASVFAQGKGGFGGRRSPAGQESWVPPEGEPDRVVSLPVGLNQSLIYRLSGDRTLHGTDPVSARADGFERPVFYGLGTFGVACRALLKGLCDSDTARFRHMEGRFSESVHPGDKLDTLIWRTQEGASFRVLANSNRVVVDRGVFRFNQTA